MLITHSATAKFGRNWPAAYGENNHGGDSFSGIWWSFVFCVRSLLCHKFDVIFMFPNQRFGDVCWHNKLILLHALPLFYIFALNINYYQRSKFEHRRKMNSTIRHNSS